MDFDWTFVEPGVVDVHGQAVNVAAFTISFSPVTVSQFEEFLRETGYKPVPDAKNYEGYLVENIQINMGRSRKLPMIGVTYDDACAYCDWSKVRVPSESELAHFFRESVRKDKRFDWAFACWTSTPVGDDHFIAGHGPYVLAAMDRPYEKNRLVLHRHSYDWPNPACLRVVQV